MSCLVAMILCGTRYAPADIIWALPILRRILNGLALRLRMRFAREASRIKKAWQIYDAASVRTGGQHGIEDFEGNDDLLLW